jgi:hypothetical protein
LEAWGLEPWGLVYDGVDDIGLRRVEPAGKLWPYVREMEWLENGPALEEVPHPKVVLSCGLQKSSEGQRAGLRAPLKQGLGVACPVC